jgi:hypothetical protein
MRENPFLSKKLPDMHKEPEVQKAVERHEHHTGEKVPNDPVDKLGVYMHRLENIFLNPDERIRERNIELLKPVLHEEFVIRKEDVPESYFELQKRVLRERGQTVEEIPDHTRARMIDVIREDQTARLDEWVDYLSSDDAMYPTWFKYFAFRNIIKLSQFDKERAEFKKRSKSTTSTFPDIYREALAIVCDKYIALSEGLPGRFVNDEESEEYASKKFPHLYALEIQNTLEQAEGRGFSTKGKWIKYDQDETGEAERLYGSLQGKGTGWCTAGQSTAKTQIENGDFYVYYTYKNEDEEQNDAPTIPRLAIRMDGKEHIGEVRGVLPGQEVELALGDVIQEKLGDFGDEASKYEKKISDMKRLTVIDTLNQENQELSNEDLRFLYEADGTIEGFGYRDDRVEEIIKTRDKIADMQQVLDALTHEETLKLFARKPYDMLFILPDLKGIDEKDVVDYLAKENPEGLIDSFHIMENPNIKAIINKIIEEGNAGNIVSNFDMLSVYISLQEIFDRIPSEKHAQFVLENPAILGDVPALENVQINYEEIIDALLEKNNVHSANDVLFAISNDLPEINKNNILKKLIANNLINKGQIAEALELFHNVSYDIAKMLVDSCGDDGYDREEDWEKFVKEIILRNISAFREVDRDRVRDLVAE